jgi:hypothetical protein
MKRFYTALCALSLLGAQAQDGASSGRTRVGAGIDGAAIMLEYSRPVPAQSEGETNKLFCGFIPYNKAWPVGGKPAALISSDKELVIGKAVIPAGTNSLYVRASPDGTAKLLISKQPAQRDSDTDFPPDAARVDLEKETLPRPVGQFTMAVVMDPGGGGRLKLMMQTTELSVRFFVRK